MAEITFIEQSHEIIGWYGDNAEMFDDTAVGHIADVARTCYQSKPKAEAYEESQNKLVRALVKSGHHSMLEHSYLSVRFVTDRAIANEMVRHRHFSYAQLSTRYVNSTKRGFQFIMPDGVDEMEERTIVAACQAAANSYERLIMDGTSPQIARAVLPLCTATEIVMSGNFRAWRQMLQLRVAKDAHPQIRSLMAPLLVDLKMMLPIVFDDIDDGVK